MKKLLWRLWFDQRGQALTEYGLILVLIAVVVIGALIALGGRLDNIFDTILGGLNNQAPVPPAQ